ncbi:hypothetical protein VTN00DRAFT_2722 [Thermoascus crustaceus]|uniref:uncharacterized protein n=1 Tax=Thermoascus crustaceus TaxID=5088 RepID=UPI003741FFAD
MERKGELHEFFDNVQKRLGAVEEFLRGDQSDVIVTMKPTGDPRISCLRRTQNQPIEASFLYILGIRRLALAYQEGFGSEALPDAGSRSTGQVRSFSENHSFPVDLARAALKPGRKTLFIENYLGQPGITLVFMLSTRALERMLPHQVEKVCLLLSFGEYPKISQLASDLSHDLISYQQIFNRRVESLYQRYCTGTGKEPSWSQVDNSDTNVAHFLRLE